MQFKTRDIALATGLLMLAVTGVLVGVTGLLHALLEPPAAFPRRLLGPEAAVVSLLFGLGLLATWRRWPPVGRWALATGVLGVLVSGLAWHALHGQHQQRVERQADFLLDNIRLNAEQVVRARLSLLERMASRLDASSAGLEASVLQSDVANYLRDIPSLGAIGLLDERQAWEWRQARDDEARAWLGRWTGAAEVRRWLDLPFPQPRLMVPDPRFPERALMAIAVPSHRQQLVALLDLGVLFDRELRVPLDGFQVTLQRGGERLSTLTAPGVTPAPVDARPALASRHLGLPGGPMLTAVVHPADPGAAWPAGGVPTLVALAGLTLGYLLAFSLGLVRLNADRSRELERSRRALWESEQRYRSLFAYNPDAVFSLDLAGRFVTANEHCATLTGHALEEILGSHFAHFIHEHDFPRIQGFFEATARGEPRRYELEIPTADGQVRRLDLTNLPIVVNDEIRGVYGIAKDITQRSEYETRLRILERGVEASVNGVLIADARRHDLPIIYVNAAFQRMTGYRREEILGRNCRFLQGPETDREAVRRIRLRLAQHQEVHVTLCNYRKDGTPFWNDLFISPVRDEAGQVTHFVGVQHDISEHKAYEARLAYHAHHDVLTGLANRALLEDRLDHDFAVARRQGTLLAVLFMDLDEFKPINDSLGHAVGDRLLLGVARRMESAMRSADTLARFGGDEFVALLTGLQHEEQAIQVAERLLELIARPYCIDGHELYLTTSIGIAVSGEEVAKPTELIQQADMAMYRAKQQGRNAYQWFTPEITSRMGERVVLRNELQEAIEQGAFELHYQPLFDRDGGMVGVEALLRWPHPERGYVSPGVFIPFAEETGQIMPLSRWVLRRACRDMQALVESGHDRLRVAVNLSPLQFHRSSFLATLRDTLRETGLATDRLALELTEGILMNDTQGAIETLDALHGMGIRVAIDDFGTGYSSLSYLKNLPIDTVKIDRSFVCEVTRNPRDAAIIQGIISMAHHLGLKVAAEGIEDADQHRLLVGHGCDLFQGFYLARPMPLDRLHVFIEERLAGREA